MIFDFYAIIFVILSVAFNSSHFHTLCLQIFTSVATWRSRLLHSSDCPLLCCKIWKFMLKFLRKLINYIYSYPLVNWSTNGRATASSVEINRRQKKAKRQKIGKVECAMNVEGFSELILKYCLIILIKIGHYFIYNIF
jgi:hypothetical protein